MAPPSSNYQLGMVSKVFALLFRSNVFTQHTFQKYFIAINVVTRWK